MNFILCIGITIYRTSQSHHPPAIVEDAPALAAVPPALAAVPPALAAVPPALAAVPQALAAAPLAPEIIALPQRERIVRRRNGEVVGRFVGNRLIRERNAPALRQERRIIVPQPALAEPLLWENLPHQQVPNELVRLLFRPQPLKFSNLEWGRSTYATYVLTVQQTGASTAVNITSAGIVFCNCCKKGRRWASASGLVYAIIAEKKS